MRGNIGVAIQDSTRYEELKRSLSQKLHPGTCLDYTVPCQEPSMDRLLVNEAPGTVIIQDGRFRRLRILEDGMTLTDTSK